MFRSESDYTISLLCKRLMSSIFIFSSKAKHAATEKHRLIFFGRTGRVGLFARDDECHEIVGQPQLQETLQ